MSDPRKKEVERTLAWLASFIATPVALVRPDGKTSCNRALDRILEGEGEAGRRRLRDALRGVGIAMRAPATNGHASARIDASRLRVRTAAGRYRLEPHPAPHDCIALGLVRVHASRSAPDPDSLAHRFGLTRREAEVAMLLGSGLSTKSIAVELRLSAHTVRRHTENVFRKVGVTSRAALAGRLHGAVR